MGLNKFSLGRFLVISSCFDGFNHILMLRGLFGASVDDCCQCLLVESNWLKSGNSRKVENSNKSFANSS